MIARFEIGDVLLATSIGDVFARFGQTILAGYIAFAQFCAKGEMIQTGQPHGLGKCEPSFRVKAACQLDLHRTLAFARA